MKSIPSAQRWSAVRLLMTLALCALGWAIVAALCLCVGSTTRSFHWPTFDQYLFRREPVLLASLVGAALASAGVGYQAILRNPLADPYLLGVSSGASLAAYLWQFAWVGAITGSLGATIGSAINEQAFAFVGALVAVAIVFLLASRRGRLEPITLLLVGVIVNAVNGSIFLLVNALYYDRGAGTGGPLNFLIGGMQTNLTTAQELSSATVIALGWAFLMFLSGRLNVAVLSESEAIALGVRIHNLRWEVLITGSLMTAAAVAVSGPIGFVGLVAPHVARLIVGTDHRKLLPVATALGAALLAIADAASRALSRPDLAQTLLPAGVLTGLLGGPFFLLMLWQRRRA